MRHTAQAMRFPYVSYELKKLGYWETGPFRLSARHQLCGTDEFRVISGDSSPWQKPVPALWHRD